ncbi:hypothetical protein [Parendozoicomonas haliclonae]|uniref:Lipopolysaccharide core heptose(II)-phosphate phosphatase n=1 Tax=Parendozoicomonas haliclonae TaxID=1960125 RepID=A0A1X7AM36_9GAMM|nr:hypothetical protein [Parendozoicomonas haliclonae]SMA49235.1 Lipopolysaccharide core heptose(II)-phosphate phosphatase precursor [Parendozoicomonas haliclonae]
MKRYLTRFFFTVAILGAGFLTGLLTQQLPQDTESLLADDAKGLFDLKSHWAQGNIVSLVRHGERCDRSDNICLDGEDGITLVGKEQTIELGKDYLQHLPMDNTIIYNSPVKRTEQSADFMFGERSETKNWLREGCKENLLQDILKYKQDGKNLILVTHSTCIDALGEKEGNKLIEFDIHEPETYGGSFFLAVDKSQQKVHVLGYLLANDWDNSRKS